MAPRQTRDVAQLATQCLGGGDTLCIAAQHIARDRFERHCRAITS